MKISAIICELNPAHQGHKYIFEKAKTITDSDYVIALMSGNYVQRGEPAIYDKYIRTKMALDIGADLVIELPGIFATGSVEYFSRGSVSLLDKLQIVNYLVFGSESDDINILNNSEKLGPNDILGSGYIKAIDYLNSNIIPIPIKRKGAGYNDSVIHENQYPSALSIRELLYTHQYEKLNTITNDTIIYPDIKPVHINDFSKVLISKLLYNNNKSLDVFFDIYEDLSNKINQNINYFESITQYCDILKSKDIAYAHLKRALLHIILDYTKKDFDMIKDNYFAYCRILGFKKSAGELLKALKINSEIPIISKLADASNYINKEAAQILNKDISASHLYNYVAYSKIKNEYTQKIIIQ